jgi:hypothetical protein
MRALVAVTLAAVLLGVLGSRAGADSEATRLLGSVDDTATITLKNEDGTPVTTLAPGAYDIAVTDSSSFHNFHLTGPGGLDRATGVPEMESPTWSVTLVAGSYHFQCDPHFSFMFGNFTVAETPPPPPPPGPPPPGPPPPAPPPPPLPPPPPPPPPASPARPAAPVVSAVRVRTALRTLVVVSLRVDRAARGLLELRRKSKVVASRRPALKRGANVVRIKPRRALPVGRYQLRLRVGTARPRTYGLRLR